MSKVNVFKVNLDLFLNYDDKFWDNCIDNYRIMYWATNSLVIQVNPLERDNGN